MDEDLRKQLADPNHHTRRAAWTVLQPEFNEDSGEDDEFEPRPPLTLSDLIELHGFVREEHQRLQRDSENAWAIAVTVYARLVLAWQAGRAGAAAAVPPPLPEPAAPSPSVDSGSEPQRLADWLWNPLKDSSVVLYLSELQRQRDADASLLLGRHLSFDGFANTEFIACPPESDEALDLGAQLKAAVIIGRMGLYGSWVRGQFDQCRWPRFFFPVDRRPEEWRPGKIVPGYHSILERISCLDPKHAPKSYRLFESYETTETDQERIDYGWVKCYPAEYDAEEICVIECAGSSTPGTLGTVKWAARKLVG
ncbi:MAG: hypothetical protein ACREIV_12855, partial [Planctomycetaceae bacterium]